jgi:hypothetical protein
MRPPALLAFAVVTASALAGGCGKDFDPYNRLTSLRVLALQADPALPATGETVTLTPLVYTSKNAATPTYKWSWCPFPGQQNSGYRCPVDESMLQGLPGADTIPPFDLGTGPTAQLPNTIDPQLLTAACGGMLPMQPERLDCTNGFPVQVMVTVTSGDESVPVVTTVRLRFTPTVALDPPIYGLDTPNALPLIDDLVARLPAGDIPIDDPPAATLPRDVETRVRADVDMSAAVESYPGADDNGNPTTLTEHLYMTWFVESGDTDTMRTTYTNETTPWEDFQKNLWTPAPVKNYPGDTARLIVVIHDNRGGVSWRSGFVNLGPTP